MEMKLNYDTLIKEVQQRTSLWDRRDQNHKNIILVGQLWGEISEKLNAPVEIIKKKWKNLRDRFRSQYKLLSLAINGNENIKLKSNWCYFDSLLFLINQTELNTNKKLKDNENHFRNLNETQQQNLKFNYDEKAQNQLNAQRISKSQNKKHKINYLEKDSKFSDTTRDEDEAFFQSLIPHIEKMEPERRLLCQIEIQKVIYNFAYK